MSVPAQPDFCKFITRGVLVGGSAMVISGTGYSFAEDIKPLYNGFSPAFSKVIGTNAQDELLAAAENCSKPIVLIAGDQCTGKGTAADALVAVLGGSATGTGTVLRALAKEHGLSIEQMRFVAVLLFKPVRALHALHSFTLIALHVWHDLNK